MLDINGIVSLEMRKSKYDSIDILLDIVKKEYDVENDEKQSIDSRTGILITLTMATIVFIFNNANNIIHIVTDKGETYFYALYVILVLAVSGIFIGLLKFVTVASINGYAKVNMRDIFYQITLGKVNASMLAYIQYEKIVDTNRDINRNRYKILKEGITFLKWAVLLFGVVYILPLFF